ncbi:hypothetical protein DY000_02022027 [Brassica cretica]|uniref:Histone deacetylase interacting domain-containing protein n=1 Tax=Brassica cretica TaxID=69181 RepID=A0ABQ7E3I5_BRACR|nr:hypothetical protein DY000_02022027 [Brassica cretica]
MPNRRYIEHFKSSRDEVDQRRLFIQFGVQEFCDSFEEKMTKALKDVNKSQEKSTTTTIAELTFFQPEHLSSLRLFSQDFEEEPFDYPHQGPLLSTRRPMDDDLCPIFDEEDDHLDSDLGPMFD